VNSREVQQRVEELYQQPAEILVPPPALSPDEHQVRPDAVEPGFWLCVARLLPYKNVDVVLEAFRDLDDLRLVIVGQGPEELHLRSRMPDNVSFCGRVSDAELRWLYAHCRALVTASYEDLGLVPLEAATFGRPVAALGWGGHYDTVVDGQTGVLFRAPEPQVVREAVLAVDKTPWSADVITAHAQRFGPERFRARIREVVEEELARI
jgi:glycosyltransferase involved in cell wall biosynthesis